MQPKLTQVDYFFFGAKLKQYDYEQLSDMTEAQREELRDITQASFDKLQQAVTAVESGETQHGALPASVDHAFSVASRVSRNSFSDTKSKCTDCTNRDVSLF